MLINKPQRIPTSEITAEDVYLRRREFIKVGGIVAAGSALGLSGSAQAGLQPDDELKPENIVTTYNNFYEFGTGKDDPARYAHEMTVEPWTVSVSGEAKKTGKFDIEDILGKLDSAEYVYRFRCVEAWSMVVPWMGVPLKAVLEQFEPTDNAKYVQFETLVRPKEIAGPACALFQH